MKLTGYIFLSMLFFTFSAHAGDGAVLHRIYQTVADEYIEPVAVGDFAPLCLKGLGKMDKKLRIADDGSRVSVYYGTTFVKGVLKPEDKKDIDAWVKLSLDVMSAARKASSEINRRDFEMVDYMMVEGFPALDADSKYYPDLDITGEKNKKTKRYFYDRMIDDVLYIKAGAINQYTGKNLEDSLKKNKEISGLILDLRGSPGGMLSEAVKIAGLFLDEGIIVSTQGRSGDSIKFYNAEEGDILEGRPIVILIDGQTASSAEVIASSLKEQGRAKVVGTRSFGKGTVQTLKKFDNDSEAALTNAYFYTPSGYKIDKTGVYPDLCTAGMLETTPLEKILPRFGIYETCERENRENMNIDVDAAVALIQEK